MPTVALIPSWDGLGYGDKPNAYPFLTTPSQLVKAQQVRLGCSVCLESGILGERHPSMCKAWDGSAGRQVDTYALIFADRLVGIISMEGGCQKKRDGWVGRRRDCRSRGMRQRTEARGEGGVLGRGSWLVERKGKLEGGVRTKAR
ncbi:hypothetical protein K469DRAFT_38360 [Zopfia rhizophila CBS 207.26]|uniref:Uncharacterized protein n=1 Tax=Zopfia rhizophila CBS 207.26 TaxID=1314779 RepID=A0A6A6DC83_9PEZI|nr:hypothetical protein K469DRAFT_38360 [Zopfia rhizophila CBS 207.26]